MSRSPVVAFAACILLAVAWWSIVPSADNTFSCVAAVIIFAAAAISIGVTMRVPAPEAGALVVLFISAAAVVKSLGGGQKAGEPLGALMSMFIIAAAAHHVSIILRERRAKVLEFWLALFFGAFGLYLLAGITWSTLR